MCVATGWKRIFVQWYKVSSRLCIVKTTQLQCIDGAPHLRALPLPPLTAASSCLLIYRQVLNCACKEDANFYGNSSIVCASTLANTLTSSSICFAFTSYYRSAKDNFPDNHVLVLLMKFSSSFASEKWVVRNHL